MARIPLGDFLRFNAQRKPTEIAVEYPDATLTWAQLESRASQRARLFQSLGVGKGDTVTIALPNSSLFHESAFAAWKLGASVSVVSYRLPGQEFQAIEALAKPKLVIARPDVGETQGKRLDPDADTSGFDDSSFDSEVSDHWKVMTSGGSTGRPKLIVDHAPAAFDFNEPGLHTVANLPVDGVVLNPGPLYHNAPFSLTHFALARGNKVVGMARFDAEEALRLIDEHKVNWVNFVPAMMHRIWSLPPETRAKYDVSSLHTVWHMAAPCPAWLKRAWMDWLGPERIWELYGGTEANGISIINGVDWLKKPGSVGKLVNGTAKAVDPEGRDLPPGEIGEIFMRLSDPTRIPSHYVGAEPRTLGDGWNSIGDLGHVDEEGYIFLADRRTDLILRGGANIYPAEVEGALDRHPDVGSSIAVGLPCDELGQRVHAIVQPRPGRALDLADLHGFMGGELAKYKLPESYEIATEPLRDDAGKARRSALRDDRIAWMKEGRDFRLKPQKQPA